MPSLMRAVTHQPPTKSIPNVSIPKSIPTISRETRAC